MKLRTKFLQETHLRPFSRQMFSEGHEEENHEDEDEDQDEQSWRRPRMIIPKKMTTKKNPEEEDHE